MAERITLAVGGEDLLVARVVARCVAQARAADPSVQRFDIPAADESAAVALREACAPTLFGDGAVVVVTGIDGADDALAKVLRTVMADLPDNVSLVLTHPGGVKGKALLDAVKATGAQVENCAVLKGTKQYADFVAREFSAARRKATSGAVTSLVEAIGTDLSLLASAVSQLVVDLEADPIDVDDVRAYFDGVAEVSGFAISDAVWERRLADAFVLLRQSMLVNDDGAIGPMSVAAMAGGLRSLVRFGGLSAGVSDGAAAREIGCPEWKVGVLRRQWARWSGDERRLARAVVALADADGQVKGGVGDGTALDPAQKLLVLEDFVTSATASAGSRA